MDQNETLHNPETAYKSYKHYSFLFFFFKNITLHLLLRIFLFLSFVLSFTSALSYLYYNYYFSGFVFPLIAHTLQRKYMFLICTGILTFITKSSGFSFKENAEEEKLVYGLSEMEDHAPVSEDINITQHAKEEEGERSGGDQNDEQELQEEAEEWKTDEEERERGVLIDGNEDGEEEEDDDDDGGGVEEEGYCGLYGGGSAIEEGNEVTMNTEELNKKIEEFIRKMKEELKIEAQQHLITV